MHVSRPGTSSALAPRTHLMARHMAVICCRRSSTASMDVRAPRRFTRLETAMLPPTAAMEPASSLRAVFARRCASCGGPTAYNTSRDARIRPAGTRASVDLRLALPPQHPPSHALLPPHAVFPPRRRAQVVEHPALLGASAYTAEQHA